MRDHFPDERFNMDFSLREEYSPRHGRRMSPPPAGDGRDQNSPRRPRPRLEGRNERGRDGRGDLRRVGQEGRSHFRGIGSDGWENDVVRPYDIRNEIRWPDVRSDGRRPDSRGERRRLNIRSEGRRPDIGHEDRQTNIRVEGRRPDVRNEGRQQDARSDSRRLDFRTEGRRSAIRRDGRRPDFRSEERQPERSNELRQQDGRGGGRRPELKREGRNLDIGSDVRRLEMSEDRRLEARNENRRLVGRSKVSGRHGESEEQHSRRHSQASRDSRQDKRGVLQREEEHEKTGATVKGSVSEEEPEGHSGHSHGEESASDSGTRRDSHSDGRCEEWLIKHAVLARFTLASFVSSS